jgi:anaerobic selenocysteine-containing dehydrogenase
MNALWNGRLEETGHSIAAIRAAPGGVIVLPPAEPGGFLERIAATMEGGEKGKGEGFDACPDALLDSLERAEPLFESLSNESSGQLKLITRRTHHMLNSTLQNLKELKTEKGARTNPLYMNPRDAAERGLEAGNFVIVRNDHGQVIAELALDANLRPGVVAMSHGFGNDRTPGMPIAQAYPGVNVNALSPSGAGSFDPVSAMSHLTGIAVEVLRG